ncbi:MAG: hypothetical protein M1817_003929 [Caeruleum heppii]|nr:MAG: hypothetical protein M1817_003929 [Caeruleum heppii]
MLSSLFHLPWVFFLCFYITRATYDPSRPHSQENFDPIEADPQGHITCLGPLPAWALPKINGWDPNTATLQEICAKPQYGGKARWQHIGGYCPKFDLDNTPLDDDEPEERPLAFDRDPRAQASVFLSNPRTVQPFMTPWLYETKTVPSRNTYEIKIDRPDDFSMLASRHRGTSDEPVLSTELWIRPELMYHATIGRWEYVSIDEGNRIECEGPFPTWPLPAPFEAENFESLQGLCAVQLSGGETDANAGGYCHRNSDGSERDVAFSDEMTPRLDWTWDNLRMSAAIRFHCWLHCRCRSDSQPKSRPLSASWQLLAKSSIVQLPDGSINLDHNDPAGTSAMIPILSSGSGSEGTSPPGTCGADGKQFCPMAWPTQLLGPKPIGPVFGAKTLEPAASPPPTLPSALTPLTCGAQCTSNEECDRTPGAQDPCRCIAVGEPLARGLGLDPVFPSALCLVMSQTLVQSLGKYGRGKRRRARGLIKAQRDDPTVWGCVCNATYVSTVCCEPGNTDEGDDGMVWEEPEMKLGILAGP